MSDKPGTVVQVPSWAANSIVGAILGVTVAAAVWAYSIGGDVREIKGKMTEQTVGIVRWLERHDREIEALRDGQRRMGADR